MKTKIDEITIAFLRKTASEMGISIDELESMLVLRAIEVNQYFEDHNGTERDEDD